MIYNSSMDYIKVELDVDSFHMVDDFISLN